MINFEFTLKNIFVKDTWKSLYSTHYKVSKNKTFEFQVCYTKSMLLYFKLDTTFRGRDHAGIECNFGILGFEFLSNLNDNRHWDYENNCWEKHDE